MVVVVSHVRSTIIPVLCLSLIYLYSTGAASWWQSFFLSCTTMICFFYLLTLPYGFLVRHVLDILRWRIWPNIVFHMKQNRATEKGYTILTTSLLNPWNLSVTCDYTAGILIWCRKSYGVYFRVSRVCDSKGTWAQFYGRHSHASGWRRLFSDAADHQTTRITQ